MSLHVWIKHRKTHYTQIVLRAAILLNTGKIMLKACKMFLSSTRNVSSSHWYAWFIYICICLCEYPYAYMKFIQCGVKQMKALGNWKLFWGSWSKWFKALNYLRSERCNIKSAKCSFHLLSCYIYNSCFRIFNLYWHLSFAKLYA